MADSNVLEDDDFEKLLDSFINDSLDEAETESDVSANERINQLKNA